METTQQQSITVDAVIAAPRDLVWKLWTTPDDIVQWNNASSDWHTPRAQNDLRKGGKFLIRMEAKDDSAGFDFGGVYDAVIPFQSISYTMEDGRKVAVTFTTMGIETKVTETFEAEHENSIEMQRGGWQAILDNFKHYAEKKA